MKALFYLLCLSVMVGEHVRAQTDQKINLEREVRAFKMKMDSIPTKYRPSIYFVSALRIDDSEDNYFLTIRSSINEGDYCQFNHCGAYFEIDSAIVLFNAFGLRSRFDIPRYKRPNIHVIAAHYKFKQYITEGTKFYYWIKVKDHSVERGISARNPRYLDEYPTNYLYESIAPFIR